MRGLALESALWCRYCDGVSDSGAEIALAWLEMADIYCDTVRVEPFRTAFADWLRALWSDGTRAVLTRYLHG